MGAGGGTGGSVDAGFTALSPVGIVFVVVAPVVVKTALSASEGRMVVIEATADLKLLVHYVSYVHDVRLCFDHGRTVATST
jgi:hypothetical protein